MSNNQLLSWLVLFGGVIPAWLRNAVSMCCFLSLFSSAASCTHPCFFPWGTLCLRQDVFQCVSFSKAVRGFIRILVAQRFFMGTPISPVCVEELVAPLCPWFVFGGEDVVKCVEMKGGFARPSSLWCCVVTPPPPSWRNRKGGVPNCCCCA